VLLRSDFIFTDTGRKVIVIMLAAFRLDELVLFHFVLHEGGYLFFASKSFSLVGFEVVEVFKQASNPDFKDTFNSDETAWVFLVLEDLAAVRPL